METVERYDVLVLGSGIAGLGYAIRLAESAPLLRIAVLSKSAPTQCSTALAQGGIAAAGFSGSDSFEAHIRDTLAAGRGHCNAGVVKMTVEAAPAAINDLLRWGVRFDSDANGNPHLHREGGHSADRIWHSRDHTGSVILNALLHKAASFNNIIPLHQRMVIEILRDDDGGCAGLKTLGMHDGSVAYVLAGSTLLAGGGCCAVYENTTNPLSSTGDAVALAYRAGAEVRDMDMIQFHPTALQTGKEGQRPLMTEALRGAGARIINEKGERFLFRYDSRGELATRDKISQAICLEMEESGNTHVWLDCRAVPDVDLHFPTVAGILAENGLSVTNDLIPVAPAAHYQCGGIVTDAYARTGIEHLYAVGECASTGLHGSNRLASNSLLEALVFSSKAAEQTLLDLRKPVASWNAGADFTKTHTGTASEQQIRHMKRQLRSNMNMYCGVIRRKEGLLRMKHLLNDLRDALQTLQDHHGISAASAEFGNMITVSELITEQARNSPDAGAYESKTVNPIDKINTHETPKL